MFREDEIIILIGAGCSADAGIPTTKEMIDKLEGLLKTKEWEKYSKFYHFIKSASHYAEGIKGNFEENFDIERLINVISELEKKENSILYPFIGSWNPRLLELAGYDFNIIKEFKQMILEKLKGWVTLDNYKKADYYKNFFDFQSEYNFSLRIFSLNYDLCLEKNIPERKEVERGFDKNDRIWDWRRFEPREEDQPSIYLYKLHGSIDWERDLGAGSVVKEVDKTPEVPDLIFGTDYKMQYIDPYLFSLYELRKYSLISKVILAIGYSFRDEHINGILEQALKNNCNRRIITVSPKADEITSRMFRVKGQLIPISKSAKDFLNNLKIEKLENILGSQ